MGWGGGECYFAFGDIPEFMTGGLLFALVTLANTLAAEGEYRQRTDLHNDNRFLHIIHIITIGIIISIGIGIRSYHQK